MPKNNTTIVKCKSCGQKYEIETPQKEKRYRCKKCNEIILVKPYIIELTEDDQVKTMKILPKVLRLISVILLFWALARHPYVYYQILRFVICGTALYTAFIAMHLKKQFWIWLFCVIAGGWPVYVTKLIKYRVARVFRPCR